MRKAISSILVFVWATTLGFSQAKPPPPKLKLPQLRFPKITFPKIEKEKRHFISFNVGPSFAVGKYGSTSSSNGNAGFANTGFNLNLEEVFYFIPYIGLGEKIGGFINRSNNEAYGTALSQTYPTNTYTGVNIGNWSNRYIMFGPCFTLPFKDFSIDAKFFVGDVSVTSPTISYTLSTVNGSENISQASAKGHSFGINPGIGVRLNVSERWAFRMSLDMIYGNPSYQANSTVSLQGIASSSTTTYTQPIRAINLGFGIVYRSKKKQPKNPSPPEDVSPSSLPVK